MEWLLFIFFTLKDPKTKNEKGFFQIYFVALINTMKRKRDRKVKNRKLDFAKKENKEDSNIIILL